MLYKLLFFICILPFTILAQNKISELYQFNPCKEIPCNQKIFKTWLDSTFGNQFIKNLQHSSSPNNDNEFFSFSLLSKTQPIRIKLYDLPISLQLATQGKSQRFGAVISTSHQISFEYSNLIMSYDRFRIVDFDFSPQSYFFEGLKIYKLTNKQIIGHVLNFFIEDNSSTKEDKISIFVKVLNRKKKLAIKIPNESELDISWIVDKLESQKINIPKLIYECFIDSRSNKKNVDNLNQFYNIMSPEGIINEVNNKINITIQANFGAEQKIILPKEWILCNDTSSRSEQPLTFQYANFLLNREKQQFVLTFDIITSDSISIVNGNEEFFNHNIGKKEIIKITSKNPKKILLKKLIINLSKKETMIKFENDDYSDLFINKIHLSDH